MGSLKKISADLQAAVKDREAKVAEQAKARQAAEKTLEGAASLRAEITKLEAALHESIAERDDVVAKRDALSRQWEKQTQTLAAQLEESQKQIATLAARGKELEAARAEIASLKKESSELRAGIAERDARLAEELKARNAVTTVENVPSVRLAKLDAPIVEQQSDAAAIAELAALRSKVERMSGAAAEDRRQREKLEADVAKLEQEKQKIAAERAHEHDEAAKRIAELEKRPAAVKPAPAAPVALAKPATVSSDAAKDTETTEVARIKKWEQPDGTLFFGERPQHGSKLLGEVESMGTSGGSQVD